MNGGELTSSQAKGFQINYVDISSSRRGGITPHSSSVGCGQCGKQKREMEELYSGEI